ncbi:MAG: hypothetical protein HMLKMBBP_04009 [Planctomycetes bacterium]|nr:hypothetical protein [Planctomycetota bacterium]
MNLTLAKAADRYGGIAVCWVLAALRGLRELVAPRSAPVEARTILCIKFWGLGNVVLLLPVLRALRERHPGARIVFVSLARNREILDSCASVDDRIYVDDRGAFRLLRTYLGAVCRAWRAKPDLAIDFEQFARASAILAVLARSKQIVGLATPGQGRDVLFHKRVPYDDGQHMGQTYLDLARAAGVPARAYEPEPFPVPEAAHEAVSRMLAERFGAAAAPLAVIHPGSGDNFQGRRWPAPSFAALADRLAGECGARIVVTGGGAERALAADVASRMSRKDAVLDASGRLSVAELAALVARADALVTNDTAPVHFGSALGTPVFALYGPNTPRLYGPLSAGSHAFHRELPCSPCLTNMNYKTSHCRMPVCIQDISVHEVFLRVSAALAAPSAERRARTA